MQMNKELILGRLPKCIVKALRITRHILLVIIEPLDYIYRLVNGKGDLPPLHLRARIAPLRVLEGTSGEYVAYLKLITKLQPSDRFLDIGCGCGAITFGLTGQPGLIDYLGSSGQYVGMDNHKPSIDWCQKHIKGGEFYHIAIKEDNYYPNEGITADMYNFPFPEKTFDVIFLRSVFTHLLFLETTHYIEEISRLLSDKGRCFATFYLLNEKQEELAIQGLNKYDFKFGLDSVRYVRENRPRLAVAYKEDSVIEFLHRNGLVLTQPPIYGTWSGRTDGVSFQDMLFIKKKGKG